MMKALRICLLSLLLCTMYLSTLSAQDPAPDTEKKYWYEFDAEWVLNEDGNPVAVVARGRTNLPKYTRMRLWLYGGYESRSQVTRAEEEIKTVLSVTGVSSVSRVRGNAVAGHMVPEIVPDTLSEFEMRTDDFNADEILPGRYKISIAVDRQRAVVQELIKNNLQTDEVTVYLQWGEGTLKEYESRLRKQFESNVQTLHAIMRDAKEIYTQYRAGEMDIFSLSEAMENTETQILDIVDQVRDVPASTVARITMEYRQLMFSFCADGLIPILTMVRKKIESEVNDIDLHVPEQMEPDQLFKTMETWFEGIYAQHNLLKKAAKEVVPGLQKLMDMLKAMPDELRSFQQANDRKGFDDFMAEIDTEMTNLMAVLAGNIPDGSTKISLLRNANEIWHNISLIDFDTLDASVLSGLIKNADRLPKLMREVEKLLEENNNE